MGEQKRRKERARGKEGESIREGKEEKREGMR
jgi:hypothetical protein